MLLSWWEEKIIIFYKEKLDSCVYFKCIEKLKAVFILKKCEIKYSRHKRIELFFVLEIQYKQYVTKPLSEKIHD